MFRSYRRHDTGEVNVRGGIWSSVDLAIVNVLVEPVDQPQLTGAVWTSRHSRPEKPCIFQKLDAWISEKDTIVWYSILKSSF